MNGFVGELFRCRVSPLQTRPFVSAKGPRRVVATPCIIIILVGDAAPGSPGGTVDDVGRRFSGHWVVKPGRHEYKTLATERLAVPHDTTIHFIGIHVHPYSESLELKDLTTGKTVWKSFHQSFTQRIGVSWMDYYSSEEGLPIYKDHDYELISVYNNPTDQDSDAMAQLMIYYHDKEFTPSGLKHDTLRGDI